MAVSGRRREVVAKAVRPMQTGSAEIHGIASNVATAEGCAVTLVRTVAALGGLDVLVNNAGAVRVGRREKTDEAELQAMVDVTAAILLTRAARQCSSAVVDAIAEGIETGAFEVIRSGRARLR